MRGWKEIKGGNISGEDEEPYEAVIRYRDNTKKIEVTPSDGYEIVSVTINDEVYDHFITMWNAAKKADLSLVINDSYRSYEEQKETHKGTYYWC